MSSPQPEPTEVALRQRGWQFSMRAMLIVVIVFASFFAWMNDLAARADATLTNVFGSFLVGFVLWSFCGSIGGLAYAIVGRPPLSRVLALALLPGLLVGIAYASGSLLDVFRDLLTTLFVAGILGSIGIVLWWSYQRSVAPATNKRSVIGWMTLVLITALIANVAQAFAQLPLAFQRKNTVFVVTHNSPPIAIGTSILRYGIVIGYLSEVQISDEPGVQILKLQLHKHGPIFQNEVLTIRRSPSGAPDEIIVQQGSGNYVLRRVADGATIYCDVK